MYALLTARRMTDRYASLRLLYFAIRIAIGEDMEAAVQMNTRLERSIKTGGDAVLSQCGYSPSQAVRALWTYLCDHQDVPPFMKEPQASDMDAIRQRKLSLIHDGAGLAIKTARQCGYMGPDNNLLAGKTPHELRDVMYDDMLEEMEARCVYPESR